MSMGKWIVLASFAGIFSASEKGVSAPNSNQLNALYVGVLENREGQPSMRVAFKKAGSEWQRFLGDTYDLSLANSKTPEELTWFVTFDGKQLGNLKAVRPAKLAKLDEIGTMKVAGSQRVPATGKPTYEFSGFLGKAVSRPLVSVSQPGTGDPDKWKPYQPVESEVAELLIGLTESVKKRGNVYSCDDKQEKEKLSIVRSLISVEKSYKSRSGTKLLAVRLKPEAGFCDNTADPYKGIILVPKTNELGVSVSGFRNSTC